MRIVFGISYKPLPEYHFRTRLGFCANLLRMATFFTSKNQPAVVSKCKLEHFSVPRPSIAIVSDFNNFRTFHGSF